MYLFVYFSESGNDWFVQNKDSLGCIFNLPLSSEGDELIMRKTIEEATEHISAHQRIKRIDLKNMLQNHPHIVDTWARYYFVLNHCVNVYDVYLHFYFSLSIPNILLIS